MGGYSGILWRPGFKRELVTSLGSVLTSNVLQHVFNRPSRTSAVLQMFPSCLLSGMYRSSELIYIEFRHCFTKVLIAVESLRARACLTSISRCARKEGRASACPQLVYCVYPMTWVSPGWCLVEAPCTGSGYRGDPATPSGSPSA